MELVKEKLFEYTVIWHPTKEESKAGKRSEVIVKSTTILGADDKGVGMKAIKAIPTTYDNQLDQVEVVVRPF